MHAMRVCAERKRPHEPSSMEAAIIVSGLMALGLPVVGGFLLVDRATKRNDPRMRAHDPNPLEKCCLSPHAAARSDNARAPISAAEWLAAWKRLAKEAARGVTPPPIMDHKLPNERASRVGRFEAILCATERPPRACLLEQSLTALGVKHEAQLCPMCTGEDLPTHAAARPCPVGTRTHTRARSAHTAHIRAPRPPCAGPDRLDSLPLASRPALRSGRLWDVRAGCGTRSCPLLPPCSSTALHVMPRVACARRVVRDDRCVQRSITRTRPTAT